MKAQECLTAAKATVASHRADYGDCFNGIAALWTAVGFRCNGAPVCAMDVTIAMILLKVARQTNASNADNWVDVAGYAACGAEVDEVL